MKLTYVGEAVCEALAVHLYEADPESYFNDGDAVQWRDNHADQDRYRSLATAAIEFLYDPEGASSGII